MEIISRGPEETESLGERLGSLLAGGEIIALNGPLGAGKTVFVRGLARALGCPPDEVASPTYVIERIYPGRIGIRHIDAYRLSGAAEFEASDLGSGLGKPGSVAVLEWAERVAAALPAGTLEISISVIDDRTRRIEMSASTPPLRKTLESLAKLLTDSPETRREKKSR